MNILTQILDFLARLLRWWIVVQPWEQAVRTRLGKRTALLGPGLHFRIPFADAVYPQNVRLRALQTTSQSVTTKDDYLITVSGMLRYRIVDVVQLQTKLHDAHGTVVNIVSALIAQCIATHTREQLSPQFVSEWVTARLDLAQYGLGEAAFALQDYAAPRKVIRLIQDSLGQTAYSGCNNALSANTGGSDANVPSVGVR